MFMHDGQLEINSRVAGLLIADQFPEWATLPVRQIETAATVNAIFRVGDGLVARFPLTGDDPTQVRTWLRSEVAAAAA